MKKILLLAAFIAAYFNASAFLTQANGRWRNDDGNETTATWKAAQNTSVTISDFNTIRLRVGVKNDQGNSINFEKSLQFSKSVNGPWNNIPIRSDEFAFALAESGFMNEVQTTTKQLTGATGTFAPGQLTVTSESHKTTTPEVAFSVLPVTMQVFPRNVNTNIGNAAIEGVVKNGTAYKSMSVLQYRSNVLKKTYTKDLVYSGDSASFSFAIPIKAELANNKLEIYGVLQDNTTVLVKTVDSLLAGDAIIIQGQSNAEAAKYDGSSNAENRSSFIRVWGSAGGNNYNRQWFIGNGDVGGVGNNNGNTGQWGLRLAKRLIDSEHIPIVIYNGAHGGKPITFYEKTYVTNASFNNYSCLLNRVTESGFAKSIRAICWYQGESDSNPGVTVGFYKDSFNVLYNDWKKDYLGFKKLYIIQTKQSCAGDIEAAAIISEAHRQLALELPNASILSTQGITHLNSGLWCHYPYDSGYKMTGDYMFLMINRDVRNLTTAKNVESPQVTQIVQTASNQLTLYFKNAGDTYTWEAGTEADFVVNSTTAKIKSGVVNGATVVLTMNKQLLVDTLSFYGHMIGGSPCIRNASGEGIVAFYKLPINHLTAIAKTNNALRVSGISLQAFPNPVKEKLTVTYTMLNASKVNLFITDIAGKILAQVSAGEMSAGRNQTNINTHDLAAGIYILKLQTGENISSIKFVKQ